MIYREVEFIKRFVIYYFCFKCRFAGEQSSVLVVPEVDGIVCGPIAFLLNHMIGAYSGPAASAGGLQCGFGKYLMPEDKVRVSPATITPAFSSLVTRAQMRVSLFPQPSSASPLKTVSKLVPHLC